jgi:hypothetical protein
VLAVSAGFLALAGGVAYATIPNSTTAVISGCYGKTTGLLRVRRVTRVRRGCKVSRAPQVLRAQTA